MQVGMRQFSAESIDWPGSEAAAGASRSALALGLCESEGWVNDAGRPCEVSARLALPAIAGRCGLSLPPAGSPPPRGGAASRGFPDARFEGRLADLGGISLDPAAGGKESRRFRAMMAAHHPKGSPEFPGARNRKIGNGHEISSPSDGNLQGDQETGDDRGFNCGIVPGPVP